MGELSARTGPAEACAAPPGLAGLARATVVYGVGGVLHRLVTFLLLPVLTRYLAPADYGVSALLDVLAACLVAVFSLGLGSSLTLCYYEQPPGPRRDDAVSTALLLLAASAAVLLVGGAGGATPLARAVLGDGSRADLVVLALGTTAAMLLQQPCAMRLQFEQRAVRLVTLNLVATVLLVGFSLLGVVVLGRGVRGLWEGRLAAHVLTLGLFLLELPRRRPRLCPRVARDLLALGLPMVPSFAAVFVLLQGNRWVLSWFADLDAVGIYSVGVQLGMALGLAVSAFSTAWTPYFMSFRERPAEAARVFARVMTYYVLGMGALALGVYATARAALLVLTVAPFRDGFRVAGHAATAQLMLGAFNVLMPACTFAREIRWSSLIQLLAAALALGINLVLIPVWGLDGAGVSLALGTTVLAALMWAWNRRRGASYLQVRYEPRRIVPFTLLYVVLAILLTRPRSWSLGLELGLAAAVAPLVALVAWILLGRAERGQVAEALRRACRRVPAVPSGAENG